MKKSYVCTLHFRKPASPAVVSAVRVMWRLTDDEFPAAYRLPAARCDSLAQQHPHPRDTRIHFEEETHTYTVDGVQVPRSVTGLIHKYVNEFNAKDGIAAMKGGREWETKKHAYTRDCGEVMTDDEIAAKWIRNGEVQQKRGTLLHYTAEQFMNGIDVEDPPPEFSQIIDFYHDIIVPNNWTVYRTELSIFHTGLRIAGQVDLVCQDADERLVIIDWKRCRVMNYSNAFRSMKPPIENLPDSNYYHYCLQLELYAYILESEYGFEVSQLVLCVAHPDRASALCIELPRLSGEVAQLVEYETSVVV